MCLCLSLFSSVYLIVFRPFILSLLVPCLFLRSGLSRYECASIFHLLSAVLNRLPNVSKLSFFLNSRRGSQHALRSGSFTSRAPSRPSRRGQSHSKAQVFGTLPAWTIWITALWMKLKNKPFQWLFACVWLLNADVFKFRAIYICCFYSPPQQFYLFFVLFTSHLVTSLPPGRKSWKVPNFLIVEQVKKR